MLRQIKDRLRQDQPRGFTLVEVIIALAIGGLFIVLVFLLLHTAQVTARNGLRQRYLQKVAANLDVYKESAANNFQYPTAALFTSQFGTAGKAYYAVGNDPLSNTAYSFVIAPAAPASPTSSVAAGVQYTVPGSGVTCTGSAAIAGVYILKISLEGGGTYCLDNH